MADLERTPLTKSAPHNLSDDLFIVGIGASAGGLDASVKLIQALPSGTGMALILVQHLDPTHKNLAIELLAKHTSTPVLEATDGLKIEADHLYIVPPRAYLSVHQGVLHVSTPQRRRASLPFDFLLHSLAEACGERAACVILSGTGTDGSLGLVSVKNQGGLVLAQDPDEAEYSGMPRSAIETGLVDSILPAIRIADTLVSFHKSYSLQTPKAKAVSAAPSTDQISEIIAYLRTQTPHDFTSYKTQTVYQRIQRRMAMCSIESTDMWRYLQRLKDNPAEVALIASDLLVNVTGFFRDPKIFSFLSTSVIKTLVRSRPQRKQIRVWVAGCNTGEEVYSLAMLFREAITESELDIKLQIFASDVDAQAVAYAREGIYPHAIEADVSQERLNLFFTKDDRYYQIQPDLRATIVFVVHDLLTDPPFTELDFVSCRNLLIYLNPIAQRKVVSILHFALQQDGILLLGNSETIGRPDGRFELISKTAQLYRRVGENRAALSLKLTPSIATKPFGRLEPAAFIHRQTSLAQLCEKIVLETYAPAAVLINDRNECVFSLGSIDRYLRVVSGQPTQDLFVMARQGLRTKLRSAILNATRQNARVVQPGGRITHDGRTISFNIDVQPLNSEGEGLLLVCFVDERNDERRLKRLSGESQNDSFESELESARQELREAEHLLDLANEDLRVISEEALSAREEYQSTNEELLASKEELQAQIEELTAVNGQLEESLDRQRRTSIDLENVLYSTDIATLFLDTDLKIRFFTPATTKLFNIKPIDIDRPLADLSFMAADDELLPDAQKVLVHHSPIEREVETRNGEWFARKVLPCRTNDHASEGVVITFTDISGQKQASRLLELSQQQAQTTSNAKSHFLAAASHDLRQPLQALRFMRSVLAKRVSEKQTEESLKLVSKIDETIESMSGTLNALLDINQLEAGAVRTTIKSFPINGLLDRLRDEFTYHARARRLDLRIVPCTFMVHSDQRLLGQMIRNLLSNALKYTKRGKVLLGCRRRGNTLRIEVWDTGIGIASEELKGIFEEYYQVASGARERRLGLGLGLSILQRLGSLLNHPVRVRSKLGKGSVFTIEVGSSNSVSQPGPVRAADPTNPTTPVPRSAILVIEDDPTVRDSLAMLLVDEGYRVSTAVDGVAAMDIVKNTNFVPDLVIVDYNLPNNVDGLAVATNLDNWFQRPLPIIVLTGDISNKTSSAIAHRDCIQLKKPADPTELLQAIQRLFLPSVSIFRGKDTSGIIVEGRIERPTIVVVDDDEDVGSAIKILLEDEGYEVELFSSGEALLGDFSAINGACLLVDANLPGMTGLELIERVRAGGRLLPSIMVTGSGDVPLAVKAMKAGAADFIEKPIGREELLASISRALVTPQIEIDAPAQRIEAASKIAELSPRERQIMRLVLAGHPSKNIAADLGISQRTVDNHRAAIMRKTGSNSVPALVRFALAAGE